MLYVLLKREYYMASMSVFKLYITQEGELLGFVTSLCIVEIKMMSKVYVKLKP